MAKKMTIPEDEREATVASGVSLAYGKTKLSQVQSLSPNRIKPNPHNTLFSNDAAEYERLKADIAENGITTALHILRDGTLLAGHTRLKIASELGLHSVPVQYVESTMNDEEQRNYLIRDNLLRRHLSNEARINFYRMLYPDFDATFLKSESRVSVGRRKKDEKRLTIAQIAKETQQKVSTVKDQIQRERKKTDAKRIDTKKMETISPLPKKNGRNPSISKNVVQSKATPAVLTAKEVQVYLKEMKNIIPSMTKAERTETRKYVEQLLKLL